MGLPLAQTLQTTRTARIELRDDGIVHVRIRAAVIQTVEDAAQNMGLAASLRGGIRGPILVDIIEAEPLAPEVRHFYSGRKLAATYTRLALLTTASAFGVMMGNIYISVARPGVPIRLFHEAEAAIAWLRSDRHEAA